MIEISDQQVRAVVSLADLVSPMRRALRDLSAGKVWAPARGSWTFDDPHTTMLVMPASSSTLDRTVVKSLLLIPGNSATGKPGVQGKLDVFTRSDGTQIARMDAEHLTILRTAACAAVATELLARPEASTLAVVGTGPQAMAQIEAVRLVRRITHVSIYSRNQDRAEQAAARWRDKGLVAEAPASLASLRDADIVCTATNALAPLFSEDDVRGDVHINAIGSYRPDMHELTAALVRRAAIFVDSEPFCSAEAGELIEAFGERASIQEHVTELGAALDTVRERPEGITLYKAVGNASQDLYAAALVLERMGL